jgi:hypothetical protein
MDALSNNFWNTIVYTAVDLSFWNHDTEWHGV